MPGSQEFEGATFVRTSFRGATLRSCDVSGVTMRSVAVDGLDIDSHDLFFGSLVVNGVDVVPFVDAELNRQFPGRELQKAQTPEGLRDGWVAVQAAWETTVTNTPPELVDAHVEGEWSLAQTLRHLVLAADAWLRRPNDAPLFGGRSALDRMLSGQVSDLFLVRQYLDAERG